MFSLPYPMISVPYIFERTPWPGLIAWAILHVSDYYLTLTCARLYKAASSEHIAFDGSFELNPFFQKDIDSLRSISPRFIRALAVTELYIFAIWWICSSVENAALYEFVLGALILLELTIHLRHFRNLYLFRAIARGNAVRGRIEYARPIVLRMSAVEFLGFSGLYSVMVVFAPSWFLVGGAVICLSMSFRHWKSAHQAAKSASEAVTQAAAPPAPTPENRATP